jgi:peptidyl-prolyl cis-trans isomerase D
MIRFLQRDNRLTKALFIVIIAAASVSMVVYLIPGLTGQSAATGDTYAVVYPHWYNRFLSSGETISQQRVSQMARQQAQQQHYPDNPMIMNRLSSESASKWCSSRSCSPRPTNWASAPPTRM